MSEIYRMRPATPADWRAFVALDEEIFGWYGAQEEPAIIRSRLATFPQGCAVLEGRNSDGRPFIAGYLTTEKWSELREPALDEDPRESHRPDGRVLNITTLAVVPASPGARDWAHGCWSTRFRWRGRRAAGRSSWRPRTPSGFYERHRFRRIGERTERGIRMAIMLLELNGGDE